MEQSEAFLKHLGLTDYEAKGYLTLIRNGSLTADKVSSLGSIPLPRVYDTMAELVRRGLVFVSKSRPQVFRAADPKHILQLLKEDERRRMEERVKAIETVVPQFLGTIEMPAGPSGGFDEEIAYVKRKINAQSLWGDMHVDARKEILVFAGDLSWVTASIPQIRAALKRKVEYKVIWCKSNSEAFANVRKLRSMGVQARYNSDIGALRGLVIDGSRVSILQASSKTSSEDIDTRMVNPDSEMWADYTTILISNKALSDVFRRYFTMLWTRSRPAELVLKKRQ